MGFWERRGGSSGKGGGICRAECDEVYRVAVPSGHNVHQHDVTAHGWVACFLHSPHPQAMSGDLAPLVLVDVVGRPKPGPMSFPGLYATSMIDEPFVTGVEGCGGRPLLVSLPIVRPLNSSPLFLPAKGHCTAGCPVMRRDSPLPPTLPPLTGNTVLLTTQWRSQTAIVAVNTNSRAGDGAPTAVRPLTPVGGSGQACYSLLAISGQQIYATRVAPDCPPCLVTATWTPPGESNGGNGCGLLEWKSMEGADLGEMKECGLGRGGGVGGGNGCRLLDWMSVEGADLGEMKECGLGRGGGVGRGNGCRLLDWKSMEGADLGEGWSGMRGS